MTQPIPPDTEQPQYPGVSYVMPVLNESAYIGQAVASVLAQDYDGAKELVIAVGESTDGTTGILARLQLSEPRLKTVANPTGRTPAGLNLAIRASSNPVVIRVDAHTELDPLYTAQGVATLNRTGAANVGGFMRAEGKTPFQRAVAAAYGSPLGLGGAPYHSGAPEGPAESAYLGIFCREALDAVGLYDETFWRGQDWDLCLRLREAGYTIWFDPELAVRYWPRAGWQQVVRQFYASGVWRAELARRHHKGKSARHSIPPLLIFGLSCGLAAQAMLVARVADGSPQPAQRLLKAVALVPGAYAAGLACAACVGNPELSPKERLLLTIVMPSIHISWGLGYLRGRLFGAGKTVDTGRRSS